MDGDLDIHAGVIEEPARQLLGIVNLNDEILDVRRVAADAESDVRWKRKCRCVVRPCEQRRTARAAITVIATVPVCIRSRAR